MPDHGIGELTVVNLYAPNDIKLRAKFFQEVQTELTAWQQKHNCDQLIMTGDFNCIVEGRDKNKNNCNHNEESVRELRSLINRFQMVDAWRRLNPDKQQYTWRQLDSNNQH